MGSLSALFADLLHPGECMVPPDHGESGESGESQALARASGRKGTGEWLANGGESHQRPGSNSPLFATRSPPAKRPESEQRRGFSPDSPDSPPLTRTMHSPSRALLPEAWTEQEETAFVGRRNRLMRWGWTEPEAEKLADRLVRRDREQDDRVSCTDCEHYRPHHCGNHRAAGLNVAAVGRDLATLLQRCPGFQPSR